MLLSTHHWHGYIVAVEMLMLQCWGNSTLGGPGASATSHAYLNIQLSFELKCRKVKL